MATKQKLAVLGGDARQIAMARDLTRVGYTVFLWGLGEGSDLVGSGEICKEWEAAVAGADAVILPIPASADGVNVNCPLEKNGNVLRLSVLFDRMRGKRLYGGRLSESALRLAAEKGIEPIDYFQVEALQQRNAVPTAEGALAIAMKELPITIQGLTCAVIGYGRIGKLLAQKLKALGACVTVYARRSESRAEAETNGHITRPIDEGNAYDSLRSLPVGCRAVFNTVPKRLMTQDVLEAVPKNCVLIDLASAPGGIDQAAAQRLGLTCVWGTALPGKCMPESAGVILAQTLTELLEIQSF